MRAPPKLLVLLIFVCGHIEANASQFCGNHQIMDIAKNIRTVLSKNWSLESINSRGVSIGDKADCTDSTAIEDATRLDLNGQAENEAHASLPLNERISATTRHGGWIQTTGGVNYRIESGKVVQFGFFQESLLELGITKESDISEGIGIPDDIQKYTRHGKPAETEYYYSKQKLLIVWSAPFNMLLNINIGPKYERESA
jgi:hypothetical protein